MDANKSNGRDQRGRSRASRFSYANVVATVALIFAVTGSGAAVASHLTVRTSDIVNGAVTTPKLDNGAVTTRKLRGGAVKTGKLDDGAVTRPKLAAKSVTADKRAATPHAQAAWSGLGQGYPVPTGGAGTHITFDGEVFDVGNMWTASQPDRITIKRSGAYLLVGNATWNSHLGGNERQFCVISYTATNASKQSACRRDVPTSNWTVPQSVSLVTQLDAGDNVRLFAAHDRGETAFLMGPQLSVVWLGPKS